MTTILGIDEELSALRGMVWDLLAQRFPAAHVHRIVDGGTAQDAELDAALAELGMFGVDVPEDLGGGGGTFTHLRQVAEGCGWAAGTTRLLGTAAATGILTDSDAPAARALIEDIAGGSASAAVATPGVFSSAAGEGIRARRDGADIVLDGRASHVLDLPGAQVVIVRAVDSDEQPLFAVVPADQSGVHVERQEVLDLTRSIGRLTLSGVRVGTDAVVVDGGAAHDTTEALIQRMSLLVAADALGVSSRVLELTTAYATQREQFDRAIGSFQAVKHQAADMLVRTEMARALVDEASTAVDERRADAPRLASMAKDLACAGAAWVAGRGIQLHGGIGYTWEHEMHVYFKRAKLAEHLFGDRRWHRRRITDEIRAMHH
ncbi:MULTISPECIES: acyl-CoA dehydrogenase family protein [unclassified Microbacterium]|uniref:acyl-CoA dehydrogenase family protein n=1 Tax=unclassified Microbacterium TaxID=2609290 RepID=UPI00214BE49B|nr:MULTISPECIES: acyl-CoA dehydrogenase family protein [unclassified Microbacterium]MCR2783422.1 acyl-CoA dehydrogenase family protein [Microbacterium sp. zg.B96]WIM15709.1 acyl-CoA dehydrogenase family protein [Microbacterium sp. zg-B96]